MIRAFPVLALALCLLPGCGGEQQAPKPAAPSQAKAQADEPVAWKGGGTDRSLPELRYYALPG